ncbi:hypothetical protein JTE90_015574 [Oedothorax gibbosus]|uniref:Uncharacterized protein n=1 Tax=Oedothorax gibbosus TaxID=931172 RepID=A0AAV6THB2_9ARAC|nr:hypothetical protein JTE90_015574 [Oedothorax gibbosus]
MHYLFQAHLWKPPDAASSVESVPAAISEALICSAHLPVKVPDDVDLQEFSCSCHIILSCGIQGIAKCFCLNEFKGQ